MFSGSVKRPDLALVCSIILCKDDEKIVSKDGDGELHRNLFGLQMAA